MNKRMYFVTVRTYCNVNAAGKALNKYVEEKYSDVLVPVDKFEVVKSDIKAKMKELQAANKRCKPYRYTDYIDGTGCPHIYVRPDSTYNDNIVFSLTTKEVRNILDFEAGSPS